MEAINISQLFELHILNNINSISIPDILIVDLVALLLGIYISFIYKFVTDKMIYSTSFSVMLTALCIITASVITILTSNVLLSIGMIGSLSIIRFRTAIKDPLDIIFIFWSITVAITTATGMIHISIISSIIVGLMMIVQAKVKHINNSYMLFIKCNKTGLSQVIKVLDKEIGRYKIKSQVTQGEFAEIQIEVHLSKNNIDLTTKLNDTAGVKYVSLTSFNGNYLD